MSVCRVLFTVLFTVMFAGTAHASRFLISGADAGGGPHVIIRVDNDNNGTFETISDSFYAFDPVTPNAPLFSGGVRVATGDFDGDGNDELVTAMGPGGQWIRIWRLTGGGRVAGLLEQFAPYPGFNGGLFIATGDFDFDGRDELATAPDAGGGPHIKVWSDANSNGRLADDALMGNFFAYFTSFAGGVRLAAGNVNNIGGDELITAPGPGGGPHVKVLSLSGGAFTSIEEFFAYGPGFTGGIYLASGLIEGAGGNGAEIITAPGTGGGPHIRIFTDTNADGRVSDNPLFDEFFAYAPGFTGGVRVATGDTDSSGTFVEVVTIPGPGGGPHVRVFDDNGDAGSKISDNPTDDELMAFDPAWGGGGFVAVGRFTSSAFAYPAFPVAIPDSTSVNVVMCIPPGTGVIRDLDVGLSLAHTFNGDLDVSLTHLATGATMTLFADVGGSNEGFFVRLNDEAGTDINTATNPKPDGAIAGTFNPGGAALLSIFDGADAGGCWRLTITDDAAGDVGTLWDWVLYFTF
jgi:FG-GAP-like repeat/Proprotein convertase P-domain